MTTSAQQIEETIDKIKDSGSEKPAFSEEVLEAFLLLDLFRDVLGYDSETAKRQQSHKGNDGLQIPDITLKLLPSQEGSTQAIFVEIKKYGAFETESKRTQAISQAARYSITKGYDYGIVTDGVRWTYFVITYSMKSPRRKIARKVAEFDFSSKPSSKLGLLILERTHRSKLVKLFEVLARLHETITVSELDEIYKLTTISERIERAWNNQDGKPIPASEKPLLHLLYHKDYFGYEFKYKVQREKFCEEIVPLRRV